VELLFVQEVPRYPVRYNILISGKSVIPGSSLVLELPDKPAFTVVTMVSERVARALLHCMDPEDRGVNQQGIISQGV
jgi:hypothetical protein